MRSLGFKVFVVCCGAALAILPLVRSVNAESPTPVRRGECSGSDRRICKSTATEVFYGTWREVLILSEAPSLQ